MDQPSPATGVLPITVADVARIFEERLRMLLEESKRAAEPPSVPDESKRQVQEETELKLERARQRHLVRTSRASVSNLIHEAVNVTFNQHGPYATPTSTPRRTNPPAQSRSAFARRMTAATSVAPIPCCPRSSAANGPPATTAQSF